mmetsp:Transcript_37063/g.42121  ORF Transcript_37063/g.42121 Transcript_37063/m.42121 type:complete len:487 (+) Transcript_37063:87-1547(+)
MKLRMRILTLIGLVIGSIECVRIAPQISLAPENQVKSQTNVGMSVNNKAMSILKQLQTEGQPNGNPKPQAVQAISPSELPCDEIKRNGSQREFCEKHYLRQQGEKVTVACITNFCDTCCSVQGLTNDCLDPCRKAHIDPVLNKADPEENFIKVCSAAQTLEAMKPFCNKYYPRPSENNNCKGSFCTDCCTSELKTNSTDDQEVIKCTRSCLAAMNSTDVTPATNQGETKSVPNPSTFCPGNQESVVDYCMSNVAPKHVEKNLRSFKSCETFYCPLCCQNGLDDLEAVLGCQKSCHRQKKFSEENQDQEEADPNVQSTKSPSSEQTISTQQIGLSPSVFQFIAGICTISTNVDCPQSLCNLECSQWAPSDTNCPATCNNQVTATQSSNPLTTALQKELDNSIDDNRDEFKTYQDIISQHVDIKDLPQKIQAAQKYLEESRARILNVEKRMFKFENLRDRDLIKRLIAEEEEEDDEAEDEEVDDQDSS